MEMKPGYKQTVVGVIPEDWDIVELGNVIDYTKGFAFKSDDYQSDGVRIIRVSDTTFDSIKNVNQIYIDRDKVYLYDKWTLKEHDLVLSTVGSKPPMYDSMVGKAIIIEKQYDGALLNQNAVLIRSKKRKSHEQILLLNHFRTKRYLNYIESIFRGNANQASITLNDLFHFQLALPRKDAEQRAIAAALSDVDALITSLDRLIAKKRDIKRATMQQLLTGKTRLPGFSGEWEVKKLGDVVETILGGGTPSRSRPVYWGSNISWVTVKDFATFDPHSTQESITEAGLQNSPSNLIKKGTIITSTRMALGKAVIYEIDVSINQDLKAIFLKKDINTLFTFYWFEQNAKNIENLGSGSTVKGVSLSDLKNVSFLKPPTITEQQAIAAILSDMDAEIAALERKRDKTRALKQGMMQELLTGKTRLL